MWLDLAWNVTSIGAILSWPTFYVRTTKKCRIIFILVCDDCPRVKAYIGSCYMLCYILYNATRCATAMQLKVHYIFRVDFRFFYVPVVFSVLIILDFIICLGKQLTCLFSKSQFMQKKRFTSRSFSSCLPRSPCMKRKRGQFIESH